MSRFVGEKKVYLSNAEAEKIGKLYFVGRKSNQGPLVFSSKLAEKVFKAKYKQSHVMV